MVIQIITPCLWNKYTIQASNRLNGGNIATGFKVNGKELLNKVEEIIKEGNVRRIVIKNDEGKTYMEIPLAVGVIGVLAAPIVTALGAIAGLIADFTIEIVKKENGDAIEVTEIVKDK